MSQTFFCYVILLFGMVVVQLPPIFRRFLKHCWTSLDCTKSTGLDLVRVFLLPLFPVLPLSISRKENKGLFVLTLPPPPMNVRSRGGD